MKSEQTSASASNETLALIYLSNRHRQRDTSVDLLSDQASLAILRLPGYRAQKMKLLPRHFFIALLSALAAANRLEPPNAPPEKVRIAVSSKSLGFLDTWAAKERGFFRKHGIDAEIIAMRPPLTIGAMQTGDIDYAWAPAPSRAAPSPARLCASSAWRYARRFIPW